MNLVIIHIPCSRLALLKIKQMVKQLLQEILWLESLNLNRGMKVVNAPKERPQGRVWKEKERVQ